MASRTKGARKGRASREGTKPVAPRKKPPVEDGLTRAEIEAANAGGPGEVARLIRRGATKPVGSTERHAKASASAGSPFTGDPRLPKPGTAIERSYKGKTLRVTVTEEGFRFEGKVYRSLSGLTRTEILGGAQVNGFLWWGLTPRPTPKATPTRTTRARRAHAKAAPTAVPATVSAPKLPKGTPEQVASVARARAARAAKVAARRAAK